MLLEIKKPNTFLEIYGEGEKQTYRKLKSVYGGNIHLIKSWNEQEETLELKETHFYKRLGKMKRPGDKLYDFRKEKGLSQDALSKLSGIAKSSISQMENLKRPVGINSAKKFAKPLGIDFKLLL